MPLVLACGGGEIFIFLIFIPIISLGLLFLTYLPYRAAMNALAQGPLGAKPIALFSAALAGGLLWMSGTYAVLVMLGKLAQDVLPGTVSIIGAITLMMVGVAGWSVLLMKRVSYKSRSEASGLPPIQVWIQDLVIALLCYGAGLSIISAYFNFDRRNMAEFLPWAIYLVTSGSIGLWVALDVCRRDAALTPGKRAAIFVTIFTVFPLTLPMAIIAYFRWRGALRRAAA